MAEQTKHRVLLGSCLAGSDSARAVETLRRVTEAPFGTAEAPSVSLAMRLLAVLYRQRGMGLEEQRTLGKLEALRQERLIPANADKLFMLELGSCWFAVNDEGEDEISVSFID